MYRKDFPFFSPRQPYIFFHLVVHVFSLVCILFFIYIAKNDAFSLTLTLKRRHKTYHNYPCNVTQFSLAFTHITYNVLTLKAAYYILAIFGCWDNSRDSKLGIPADLLEVKYACNSTNCFKAFLVRDHQGAGSKNLNL